VGRRPKPSRQIAGDLGGNQEELGQNRGVGTLAASITEIKS